MFTTSFWGHFADIIILLNFTVYKFSQKGILGPPYWQLQYLKIITTSQWLIILSLELIGETVMSPIKYINGILDSPFELESSHELIIFLHPLH